MLRRRSPPARRRSELTSFRLPNDMQLPPKCAIYGDGTRCIMVRWPTSALRRPVSSRSRRVASSGCQTSGRKSQRSSCASTWASTLSVLTLAWAMALVAIGLETTTLATCGRRASATAQQLVVASRATWSVGRRTFVANSLQRAAVQGEPLAVDHLAGVVHDAGLDHALVDIEAHVTYHYG